MENSAKITEEGLSLKSYIDGSSHMMTPESLVSFLTALGVQISGYAFDECVVYPNEKKHVVRSLERTTRWLRWAPRRSPLEARG